jgi:hypothetical protein
MKRTCHCSCTSLDTTSIRKASCTTLDFMTFTGEYTRIWRFCGLHWFSPSFYASFFQLWPLIPIDSFIAPVSVLPFVYCIHFYPTWSISLSWRRKQHMPLKCCSFFNTLCGITSHITIIKITAVETCIDKSRKYSETDHYFTKRFLHVVGTENIICYVISV